MASKRELPVIAPSRLATKRPPRVFISYSRRDEESARQLHMDLTKAGLEAWFDRENLLPGERWKAAIRRAITESDYVVVLLSSHGVQKTGYLQAEIKYALDVLDEFPENKVFIIPARLEPCDPSHDKLRDLHWVDLFHSWQSGITKIVSAVSYERAGLSTSGRSGSQIGEHETSRFVRIREVAEEALKQIEELVHEELATGVATGFVELDRITTGLRPSDLVLLAGRPSMGKTALALNVCAHAAVRENKTVGIFSLEMSRQQLFLRLLCSEAQVDAHRLRTGSVDKEDWQRIIQVYGALSEAPILIDDTPRLDVHEIEGRAKQLHADHGLDLMIIDYLQQMTQGQSYAEQQREASAIGTRLKELARQLDVPMLLLLALPLPTDESGSTGPPELRDLGEYVRLARCADVVLFLHRAELFRKDDASLTGKAELIIARNRSGPIRIVNLNFIRQFARFANPELREF